MNAPLKMKSPLSRKATLLAMSISQWTARKLDKKVTKETNAKYNASKDAGRFNKLLIEAEHLKKITTLVSEARTLHYSMTKPWSDQGLRILPNMLHAEFSEKFRVIQRDFNDAVDKFVAEYPGFIEKRKADLNGMFNPEDYPSPSEIRSKFKLEKQLLPFPDADDFRSNLDPETTEAIRKELVADTANVIDNAMKDNAEQIITIVGHMASKLKDYGEGKRMHDSLVENVRELAKVLPAFNLTNDPKLDAITNRIRNELCGEEAETLKDDAKVRATVAKSADDIVRQVQKMGFA